MRRTLLLTVCVLTVSLTQTKDLQACFRERGSSLDELINNANVIVRATAVKYAKSPDDPHLMTTGVPDSTIEFRIEERLKGESLPR